MSQDTLLQKVGELHSVRPERVANIANGLESYLTDYVISHHKLKEEWVRTSLHTHPMEAYNTMCKCQKAIMQIAMDMMHDMVIVPIQNLNTAAYGDRLPRLNKELQVSVSEAKSLGRHCIEYCARLDKGDLTARDHREEILRTFHEKQDSLDPSKHLAPLTNKFGEIVR